MPYDEGPSAGDRYRIEVTRGSALRGLFSIKRKRAGAIVSIVDRAGKVVWTRPVETVGEAHHLSDLIQRQVFSARLADFEHWLGTEGSG